jgi:16S rRNA C1402 (ribose-2'-O) methylase RsmI
LAYTAGQSRFKISSTYFVADSVYVFSITLCNFIGQCESAIHSVRVVSESGLSTTSMPGGTLMTYARSQEVYFRVDYFDGATSSCISSDSQLHHDK